MGLKLTCFLFMCSSILLLFSSCTSSSSKGLAADRSPEKANQCGDLYVSSGTSSSVNDANFIITQQGDWYYYSYSCPPYSNKEELTGSMICKVPKNGSKEDIVEVFRPTEALLSLLANPKPENYSTFEDFSSIRYMQVVGDWIYWSSECAIWRVRTNGQEVQLVAEISNGRKQCGSAFWVNGDWVYHVVNMIAGQTDSSTFTYKHQLCRTSLNGKTTKILYDNKNTDEDNQLRIIAAFPDGRIYFTDWNIGIANLFLYKDGVVKETAFVNNENTRTFSPNIFIDDKGKIFHYSYEGNELSVYLCNSEDLSDMTRKFSATFTGFENAYGYGNWNPFIYNDSLYCTSNDRLTFGEVFLFNQASNDVKFNEYAKYKFNNDELFNGQSFTTSRDEYLYYLTSNLTLCRIKTDGSQWENMSWLLGR